MKKIVYNTVLISSLWIFASCTTKEQNKAEFKGQPVEVTVNKTSETHAGGNATASGKLVSRNSVNVSTRMMGYITSIPIEVGQSVRAGQQLVSINNTDVQAKGGQADAQISQAQANYNIAKKDYERFKNLFESQSASQKELDDMTARYEMAKAGLEAAKQMKNEVNAQYRYTNVTAPISGVVTAKYVDQGNMANPGMPLLTIESPTELQAQVLVSEQNIVQVKFGMEVLVSIKSTGEEIKAKVAEISQSSANTGGQYLVKINIPGSQERLPGMFVNVVFPFTAGHIQEQESAVLIPESALVRNGQLTGVYVVSEQKTAVLRWLKTGKTIGENIEILSGLKVDEPYITSSDGKLYNGVKIQIKE